MRRTKRQLAGNPTLVLGSQPLWLEVYADFRVDTSERAVAVLGSSNDVNHEEKVRSNMIKTAVPSLLAVALLASAQASQAQTNLLPVTFDAICTSTNSTGTNATGLVKEIVRGINLIDDCAVEHGLTNLDNLRLVFNPTNFSVQVVSTNGSNLCTSLSFPGGTTFTNVMTNSTSTASNQTQIVFQRDVLVETNLVASGVISGTASWTGTNMSSFKLNALLLYSEAASGTNSTEICRAVLSVGGGHRGDDDGEENPGTGNQGGNGKHLGWQNPNNPHSH